MTVCTKESIEGPSSFGELERSGSARRRHHGMGRMWIVVALSLGSAGCGTPSTEDAGSRADVGVDGGSSDAGPSDDVTFALDAPADAARTPCGAGERIEGLGCAPCEPGTFSSGVDAARCEGWTECAPGEYVARAGSMVEDRVCEACTAGTFTAEPNLSACTPWTPCGPGDLVRTPGTLSSDRTCTWPAWTMAQFDVADTNDFPYRVLVGPDGAIYVAGQSFSTSAGGSVTAFGFVRRYEPDGTPGWAVDMPSVLVADAVLDLDGTVVLFASTAGRPLLQRLDVDGSVRDSVALPITYSNYGELATDGTSFFVCGSTHVSRVARADLSVDWTYTLGPTAYPNTVVPDGLGGAFVAGSTPDVVGAAALGRNDGFLVHVDAAGAATWARQVGTADADSIDSAFVEDGDIHLVGLTTPAAGTGHLAVYRYTPAGGFVSRFALGTEIVRLRRARPDGEGAILVTGEDASGVFVSRIDRARADLGSLARYGGAPGDVARVGRHIFSTFGTDTPLVAPLVSLIDAALVIQRGAY